VVRSKARIFSEPRPTHREQAVRIIADQEVTEPKFPLGIIAAYHRQYQGIPNGIGIDRCVVGARTPVP
jgi:hypothetical protein